MEEEDLLEVVANHHSIENLKHQTAVVSKQTSSPKATLKIRVVQVSEMLRGQERTREVSPPAKRDDIKGI